MFSQFSIKALLVSVLLCFSAFALIGTAEVSAESTDEKTIIVLDPGHGGDDSGAAIETAAEDEINLSIAHYLKEELLSYENVEVFLTRDEDESIELKDRTEIAEQYGADCLISLHVNALGDEEYVYDHGATVLAATGNSQPDLAMRGQTLAASILYELEKIGLEDQGILTRESQNNTTYDNGSKADYYAIIRNGIERRILSVLIEHAFLDNEEDHRNHLSNEDQLKELARADARGIARYFELQTKDGKKPEKIYNRKERLLLQTGEHIEDVAYSERTFFRDEIREKIRNLMENIVRSAVNVVLRQ